MPLYRYVKAKSTIRSIHTKPRLLSLTLMGFGFVVLAWVLWPIITFSALEERALLQPVSPMSSGKISAAGKQLSQVAFAAGTTVQNNQSTGVDFTNANVWYPMAPQTHGKAQVDMYTLSIPKLKINNAVVVIGGDDLNAGLVHYGGTGIPGQYGTAVVFGHSMLPQFYSPTNYKSIFSLLPTLKVGDTTEIVYDGVTYLYTIFDMVVVDPTDLSVLEQHFDDSYLTLVTCVPPGTYWKRLNVKAKLTKL